jgi:hypothetical protein
MNAPDTASDGLPARAMFRTMAVPPRRRRTVFERLTMALRDHIGTGVFVAMLVGCAVLLLLSR